VAYLKQALDQYGYEVEEERSDSEYQTNVIAELPGTVSKNRVFEIGAHYDTKPNTPGADDNASGLAGLLEIGWREIPQNRSVLLFWIRRDNSRRESESRGPNDLA